MHGLVLWAIASILNDRIAIATVFMVMAINFKQMALYFALPFGVFALAKLWSRHQGNYFKIGISIIGLLMIFVLTNLLIWSRFILIGGPETIQDILFRIFPVRRGIFEGKVATFWCMVNHCGLKFLKVN